MLALAWRFSGADPFATYHHLGSDYRPLGEPDAEPLTPLSARRHKAFIYACAAWCAEQEIERTKAQAGVSSTRRVR